MSDGKRERPPRHKRILFPRKKQTDLSKPVTCPTVGKIQYKSEEEALSAAASVILAGKTTFMRAFLHKDCGMWHLTSQPVSLPRYNSYQ